MSQYLPYGRFKWLSQKKIGKFDVSAVSENSFDRYILEYPDELHELHSDYPLTPEKIDISNDMLSKYYSNIAKKYGTKLVVLKN